MEKVHVAKMSRSTALDITASVDVETLMCCVFLFGVQARAVHDGLRQIPTSNELVNFTRNFLYIPRDNNEYFVVFTYC